MLGDAHGCGEALGVDLAAGNLAAGEKSPVNGRGCRGQRSGTVSDKWGRSVSGTAERK
jgi:hypothetical protein